LENIQPESQNQLPEFRPILVTSLILIGIGLAGLLALILFTLPTLGPRWLLFFLVTLLFSGLSLPVAYYLHKRFPSKPAATAAVLVREALWFGIYADLILWLQFGRVLNFALALFIAFGLIAIEVLIRLRETSRFSPQVSDDE
jgi:hypothetical protein